MSQHAANSWGNAASPPHEEGGLQIRPMGLKVHYTFDKDNQERCLARWPHILNIQTIGMESQTIGVVDMGICLQAIAECSPELAGDENRDFAIYATDYSEPDTPLAGQGLLSRELNPGPARHEPKMITGRVTKNILAIYGRGIQETLEVKLKLSVVPKLIRQDSMSQMQSMPPQRTLTPSASMASDNAEWNPFMNNQPGAGQRQSAPPMPIHQHSQSMSSHIQGPPPPYDSSFEVRNDTPVREFQPVAPAPSSRPGSVGPNSRGQSAPIKSQTPIPAPVRPSPPAEPMTANPPAPKPVPKTQSQSRPRSRTSSRPPTGRPRGRPRKRPLASEGNTSGYEDGTDGDDGPSRGKKRATTMQVERSNSATFGSQPESLRVTASTAGSLRNFRPVAAAGNPTSGNHLQEIPRAPTPVPEPRLPGQPPRRPTQLSNLRRQSMTSQSGNGMPYPTHLSASRSFSQDAQSPVDSPVPSPMSDEPSPVDITSSPPVPRSAMYSAHSSPAPSSPILPPIPVPASQPDSGFMSGGLDDNQTDLDSMMKPPLEPSLPPPPVLVKPKPRRSRAKKQEPQPEPSLKIHTETPGPPELLPQTSLYNPPPVRQKKSTVSTPLATPVTTEPTTTHSRHPSAAPTPQEAPPAGTNGDHQMQSEAQHLHSEFQPMDAEAQHVQAEFQNLVKGGGLSAAESQPTYDYFQFQQLDEKAQPSNVQNDEHQTQTPEQPQALMANIGLAAFGPALNELELDTHWLLGTTDDQFEPEACLDELSPIGDTPMQDPFIAENECKMEPPAIPTMRSFTEQSAEPELPQIPASDPVLPMLNQNIPMSEDLHPQTDAVDGVDSKMNKNFVKRQAIKQKLEQAVASGVVPSFCSNCGAVQTPTWRKIWKQEHRGVPAYHEYSEKPGHVTAINVLERDENDTPTVYEMIKKSLGPADDKTKWTEILLCNPCGIWFSKWKVHRPPEKWEKDAERLNQTRKKRPVGGASRSRKGRTKSDAQMNLTSEMCLPTDPMGPPESEISPPDGFSQPCNLEQSENVSEKGSGRNRKRLATEPLDQGSTHSRASRASGTAGSPINLDDELGITRRLLFPSPRKDGEQKILGEVAVNIVQTGPKVVISEIESAEKKNMSRPRDQTPEPMNTDFSDLFGPTPRPSTPPPRAAANNGPFKTPTRPTPSHRPVTRSVSKSMRSTRSLNSPSQCFLEQTPTRSTPRRTTMATPSHSTSLLRRSPRHLPLGMQLPSEAIAEHEGLNTPLTRSICQMLNVGAISAIESPRGFNINNVSKGMYDFGGGVCGPAQSDGVDDARYLGVGDFDFAMLHSHTDGGTDPIMPSSPPMLRGRGGEVNMDFGGSLSVGDFDFTSELGLTEASPRAKRRTPVKNPTSNPRS